jgi:hypothetical protein
LEWWGPLVLAGRIARHPHARQGVRSLGGGSARQRAPPSVFARIAS